MHLELNNLSWQDIIRKGLNKTDERIAALITKIHLTDAEDKSTISINRSEFKLHSVSTPGNQDNVSIAVLEEKHNGRHDALVVSETPEAIDDILNGKPSQHIKNLWRTSLQKIFSNEQEQLTQLTYKAFNQKKRALEEKHDLTIRSRKSLNAQLKSQIARIQRTQKERGIIEIIQSSVTGTKRSEDGDIEKLKDRISENEKEIASVKAQKAEKARELNTEYNEIKNQVRKLVEERAGDQWIDAELEQLEKAFKLFMLTSKGSNKKAPPSSPNNNISSDLSISLERSPEPSDDARNTGDLEKQPQTAQNTAPEEPTADLQKEWPEESQNKPKKPKPLKQRQEKEEPSLQDLDKRWREILRNAQEINEKGLQHAKERFMRSRQLDQHYGHSIEYGR